MANIIAIYDRDFTRWIHNAIHKRAYNDIIRMLLPKIINTLCDVAGLPSLYDIDYYIEVTQLGDMGFIYKDTNPIIQKRHNFQPILEHPFVESFIVG